jgi:hypothetical protein
MTMPQSSSAKTNFGTLCAAMIADQGRTVKEVATKIKGTPATQFTKWKKGQWVSIDPEKLVEIVEAISDDPREQADLVMAYLRDCTPIPYRPTIMLSQQGENAKPLTQSPWSDPMRRKLEAIARAYEMDPDFAELFDFLAVRARRVEQDAKAKKS